MASKPKLTGVAFRFETEEGDVLVLVKPEEREDPMSVLTYHVRAEAKLMGNKLTHEWRNEMGHGILPSDLTAGLVVRYAELYVDTVQDARAKVVNSVVDKRSRKVIG